MHALVVQHISILAESIDDPIQQVADELDSPPPDKVDIYQDDFCYVHLVDKFSPPPVLPAKDSEYEIWFRETKQILMRAFQQMISLPAMKAKYQTDGHDIDLILKFGKEDAIATENFSVANDITEMQVRLAAMRKSGKITFEELRVSHTFLICVRLT